jgi:glycosyltransferase involved in cell wall biosynthesis
MVTATLRVAMVHGPARPEHDGVSDYVAHLDEALGDVGVEAVPIPLGPSTGEHPGRAVRAAARTAREVRRADADLVHVQFSPSAYRFSVAPGMLPLLLPRNLPLVTTLHEYGWWARPGWVPSAAWQPLERTRVWDRETGRLAPCSRTVIAGNPGHAAVLRARLGVEPVEVPIAPNVALHPDPAARRRVRSRLGLPAAAPIVAFFGFVHPVKGVRYAIEALSALVPEYQVHLLVVGGFTSQALPADQARRVRDELTLRAARLGVSQHVTFTGHVADRAVSHALQAADIGVLPFTAGVTTKSGALLAMLTHGLPVAATVADDPDPLLRDAETIVAIGGRRDSAAVAAALRRLLDDPALGRRVAARGREVVASHTWPAIARAHRALYDRAVDGLHG